MPEVQSNATPLEPDHLLASSKVNECSVVQHQEPVSKKDKKVKDKKKKKAKKQSKNDGEGELSSEIREAAVDPELAEVQRKREKKSKKKSKIKAAMKSQYGGRATVEGTASFPRKGEPNRETVIYDSTIPTPNLLDPEDAPISSVSWNDEAERQMADESTFIEMSVLKADMDRRLGRQRRQPSENVEEIDSIHSEESSVFSSQPAARKNQLSYERFSIWDDTDSYVGGMIGKSDETVGADTIGKSSDDMTWSGYTLSSLKDHDTEDMQIPFEVAASKPSPKKSRKPNQNPQHQFPKKPPKASAQPPAPKTGPQEDKDDVPLSWDVFEKSFQLGDTDTSGSIISSSVKSNRSKATSIDSTDKRLQVKNKNEAKPDPVAQKLVEARQNMASSPPSRQSSAARYSGSSGDSSIPSRSASSDPPASRDVLAKDLRSMGTSRTTAMHITATFRQQQQLLIQSLQNEPLQDQQSQDRQLSQPQQRENRHVPGSTRPLNGSGTPSAPPALRRQSSLNCGPTGGLRLSRRRSRQGRGTRYERAMQPGAVPVEGRAFGAPRRPSVPSIEPLQDYSSIDDGLPDVLLDLGLVQATPVKDDLSPVIYADGTPLSWKDMLKEKSIRRRLYALAIFVIAVVTISVSTVVFDGNKGTKSDFEGEAAPTLAPSFSPTMIKPDLLQYVTQISGTEAMNNTESPQFKALGWLSTFDVMTDSLDEMFEQRYAMATLFYSTSGDSWFEKDDWLAPNMHVCDWSDAIYCKVDGTGRRLVTGLDLTRNGLDGSLPNEVGLPPQIEFLRLSKNRIRSSLPPSIFNLWQLAVLDLNANLLSGKIPSTLGVGKNLEQLDISYNRLTGTIPTGLFSLVLLRSIELHHNELTGTINVALQNLKVLSKLDLSNNLLTGAIPNFIKSPALDIVDVGSNLLSGAIPSWFTELLTRQELHVNDNLLEGTIPDIAPETVAAFMANPDALNLVRLRKVNCADNQLTGTLPAWTGYLPTLQYFDATNNKFTGTIPMNSYTGGQWESLETLKLGNNLFTGTLGTELPPTMVELNFSNNLLSGPIPDNYTAATFLQYLILDHNPNLYSDVSVLLQSCKNLKSLGVAGTNINGTILGEDVVSLRNMEILNLSINAISGTLPSELGTLQQLKRLYLQSNSLTGTIPREIGQLEDLVTLELDSNDISGELPKEISDLGSLEVITLFGNPQLSGTISNEFCQIRTNLATSFVIGCEIECNCCSMHADDLCSGAETERTLSPKVAVAPLSTGNIFDGKARRLRG